VIPRDYITEWRAEAPWIQDFQIEQDLVISRALVEIFSHSALHEALAFRGGTALYKLHLKPPARYSEDIDLVQTKAEPAGPMMEALRGVLDPWLRQAEMETDRGPRHVRLPVRFRGRAADRAQAEGRDEHAGALLGLRVEEGSVQGFVALV
jgi:predicted nucleotidyltransferase component of viral defense system